MFECTSKMSFSEWMNRRDEVIQRHEVVKIGRVELFPEEAQEAYERGLYIVAFRRVYQVYYSPAAMPLTRRGRYIAISGPEVNRLIGHELLI